MATAEATKHECIVMDHTGDSKFCWDPTVPAEVAAARSQFNELKGRGYISYKVQESGKKGDLMPEFDPDAAMVIMAPMPAGG